MIDLSNSHPGDPFNPQNAKKEYILFIFKPLNLGSNGKL
jgi:hypothetical protein